MLRRLILPVVVLSVLIMSRPVTNVDAVPPINFIRGTLSGAGFAAAQPTSLAFGPDGRLYISDTSGRIQALTLTGDGTGVASVQQIASSTDLQEVFGIAFHDDGSMWVTNTVSGFGDASPAPQSGEPGSYAGKITRLSGTNYATRQDVITGLPVSNSGHEANGLAFGPDGRLYIAQGGTTNAGVIDVGGTLFQREEVPLGSAILAADVDAPGFNGAISYSTPDVYSTMTDQTGGDVSVYAPGFRNPYDLVWHSNGLLYVTDNGPNAGVGPGSATCTTDTGVEPQEPDELDLVDPANPDKYYGHPNRNRGRVDAAQCVYHPGTDPTTADHEGPIALLPASSDGIVEYDSPGDVFAGQLEGNLLYVSWVENTLHRIILSADGRSVVSDTTLATNLPYALDVTVGPDGTIYVAEWLSGAVRYFKPDTTPATSISVTGISPALGNVGGGQAVTITGTNFTTASETTADIGGAPVTNLVVQNSTTITGLTSLSSVGIKDVHVSNLIGSATLAGGYEYVAGGTALPPVADAGPDIVTPVAHIDHAHVTLDGRASFDPEGLPLTYEWTLNGQVISTNPVDSLEFTEGIWLVSLKVTDADNLTDTDDVRITVTATAENPEPYYCFDVDGDLDVDGNDVSLVVGDYGKRFGQPGYSRLLDWNGDRVVNSADIMGTQADVTSLCPLVDRQIRQATAGMEMYQDINVAFANNFIQVTPFIPGQGRHLVKNATLQQDTVFEAGFPESLLYEPIPGTNPVQWRLGGAMYIIPVTLHPLPPDGFDGNADAWHYHEGLCIWNYGNAVAEKTAQSWCLSQPGAPVWLEKAGWLVHLWNYHANPTGRFVEVNNQLASSPKSSTAALRVDANPGVAGVQTSRAVSGVPFTVDVVASGITDVGAFNFDLTYNPAVLSAPTIVSGSDLDRNPNANQAFLNGSGRAFSCSLPSPTGNAAATGGLKAARISCVSTGLAAGPDASASQVLASVTFNIVGNAPAGTPVNLANANVFNANSVTVEELASCNPVVSVTTTCAGATITADIGPDGDGDGRPDAVDNCPAVANSGQQNTDAALGNGKAIPGEDSTVPAGNPDDTEGDACESDGDADNDGIPDASDSDPGGDITYDDDGDGNPAIACFGGTDAGDDGPSWDINCDGIRDGMSPAACAALSTSVDADGDRIPERYELCKWGTSDSSTDSDGDGLKDCVEVADVDGSGTLGFLTDVLPYARAVQMPGYGPDGDFDYNGDGALSFLSDLLPAVRLIQLSPAAGGCTT